MKVKELIDMLKALDPEEEVVFALEAAPNDAPVYYVSDAWEAILYEHPELNRPYVRPVGSAGDLVVGGNGTKIVCALYPH